MRAIFGPGFQFANAEVLLLDLQADAVVQGELPLDDEGEDRGRLMGAMDKINDRYGRGSLVLASAGTGGSSRHWVMKQDLRTPDYTTRWSDLPLARA